MKTLKGMLIVAGVIAALAVWTGEIAARNLPEFYGTYLSQGNKLISLKQGDLRFRTGLTIGGIRSGMYGIPEPPDLRLDPSSLEIIHFSQEVSPSEVRLSELLYLTSAPAHLFDIKGEKTNPRFFRNVYGVSYNKKVAINLWVVDRNIPLNIAPVAGKPGMFRLVPKEKLQEGVYAVNFGGVGGPQYYIGNLKFYPFAFSTIEWLQVQKRVGQNQPPQTRPVGTPSSPQRIDVLPGCAPVKPR